MTYFDSKSVSDSLGMMNLSDTEWLLLRNTEDELPGKLPLGKDIDLLLRIKDRQKLRAHLYKNGCKNIRHPLRNDIRLYGVHAFEMYRTPSGVLLDINFEIVVRSLDQGQWIPLDQAIQTSAWSNRTYTKLGGVDVPVLGREDMFITTVARCIFDKKEFSAWHAKKLSELMAVCDTDKLSKSLRLVFFGYSDRLLAHIEARRFNMIVQDYLSYADY